MIFYHIYWDYMTICLKITIFSFINEVVLTPLVLLETLP